MNHDWYEFLSGEKRKTPILILMLILCLICIICKLFNFIPVLSLFTSKNIGPVGIAIILILGKISFKIGAIIDKYMYEKQYEWKFSWYFLRGKLLILSFVLFITIGLI